MILKDDTYMVIKVINSKKCFVLGNKTTITAVFNCYHLCNHHCKEFERVCLFTGIQQYLKLRNPKSMFYL